MLTRENILNKMSTDIIGRNVVYLDETDSTNEHAKRIAPESPHGTLVAADCQVSGKGRLGRSWSSPHGESVYMTLILKENIIPENASMLTIIAALAVLNALKAKTDKVLIKWPNDIVINGKKVCGILTEMKTLSDKTQYVVVGIGVNVNNETFSENIDKVATSLFRETVKKYDRAEIISLIAKEFEGYYNIFTKCGDLSELLPDYNFNLVNMNNEVEIVAKEGTYRAYSAGIDERGRLIVKRQDTGVTEKIVSGEVSVRGVYGYV